jgi:CheY-like chemotaxis protein
MTDSRVWVLVVDDDEFVRINLVTFLEDEGFEVLSAASGEEALEILNRQPVRVVVVDMRLPGMDGNAFIAHAHVIHPLIRFIVHTGSINYTLPDLQRRLGVRPEHVYLKPLADMTVLRNAIDQLISEMN